MAKLKEGIKRREHPIMVRIDTDMASRLEEVMMQIKVFKKADVVRMALEGYIKRVLNRGHNG